GPALCGSLLARSPPTGAGVVPVVPYVLACFPQRAGFGHACRAACNRRPHAVRRMFPICPIFPVFAVFPIFPVFAVFPIFPVFAVSPTIPTAPKLFLTATIFPHFPRPTRRQPARTKRVGASAHCRRPPTRRHAAPQRRAAVAGGRGCPTLRLPGSAA